MLFLLALDRFPLAKEVGEHFPGRATWLAREGEGVGYGGREGSALKPFPFNLNIFIFTVIREGRTSGYISSAKQGIKAK